MRVPSGRSAMASPRSAVNRLVRTTPTSSFYVTGCSRRLFHLHPNDGHLNNVNDQILDLHSAKNFLGVGITIVFFYFYFKSGGRLLAFTLL
jgi:hypothetical protein